MFFCNNTSGAEVALIESNASSAILEYTFSDLNISERIIGKKTYNDIRIDGTGWVQEPGKPKIPFRGELIAVPPGTNIQIDILEIEQETMSGYLISPAPHLYFNEETLETEEVFLPEKEAYSSNRFLPESPVSIGVEGYIRDQRVAQIRFFPVQHNPVQKKIRVYKKIRVRVSFMDSVGTEAPRIAKSSQIITEDSEVFDRMLKNILINDKDSDRVYDKYLGAKLSGETSLSPCTDPQQGFSVKIFVDKDGMYSLNSADLAASGINMSAVDPRQLEMSNNGFVTPIIVVGEEDGVFDQSDNLIFYGEAMTGDYTKNNVYWLYINQSGGLRMTVRDGTPFVSALNLTSFRPVEHVEQVFDYWPSMPNGEGKDHFFWVQLNAGQSLSMIFPLNNLAATTETATVRVMLYGKSDDYAHNPDHHTKVLLNGVQIHDALWNGQGEFLHEVEVPHSSLIEGNNTVELRSVGGTGAVVDFVYVNYAEIDYRDSYTAENDTLRFDAEGIGQFNMEVTGFSNNNIDLYDITDPYYVVYINNVEVSSAGGGTYKIRFGDSINNKKTYISLTTSSTQYLKPASMENDQPYNLMDTCHQADYIIIYHDSFNIDGLLSALSGQGLQLMAVRISDIYDEFNYGIFDPQAIKDFLAYAYENYESPRPAYVLLVGDANQDYMNQVGNSTNYVPTHIFQVSPWGDTPSDNWFVSIHGNDPFPEMFLGRIAVRTQAQLDNVVSKLNSYESDIPQDGWNNNVLMTADNGTSFENMNNNLIQSYLGEYTAFPIYLRQYPIVDDATQAIIDNINAGAILTFYIGHGSTNVWSSKQMFIWSDVSLLENHDRLTFVVAMSCSNGWFSHHWSNRSLAEVFLSEDVPTSPKGAIGAWMSTGIGYESDHQFLANELFNDLFINKQTELGPLTTAAKIEAVAKYGISTDNLEIFTLFGNPSTKLQLSTPNLPPIALTGGPYSGTEGQSLILDASDSRDSDGNIALYQWDIDNDGTYDYSSTSPVQSHTYPQDGFYLVKLMVTDNLGATDTATTTVSIANSSTVASFIVSQMSGSEPLSVNFFDTSVSYYEIISWTWDFGDGSPPGSGASVSHVYSLQGEYIVTLAVTDDAGATDYETAVITVNDSSTVAGFAGYPTSGTPPLAVNFTNCSTGYDQPLNYMWDFDNDGSVDSTLESPSYTYSNPGVYTVKLTVTDSDGSNSSLTKSNYISACPPPVRIASVPPVYFPTLQEAYDAALDGDIIQSRAESFSENLNINRSISITLQGGYDCTYSYNPDKTIFSGQLTISDGQLVIGNFAIE